MVKAVYKVLMLSLMGIMTLTTPACQNSDDKVISYQEEVKLSDGSMIWVDIKRHYSWSGWAPGMGNSGAYLSGAVEISWDTGFPNVGKYTIKSDVGTSSALFTLDKHNSMWVVALTVNRSSEIANYGNEIDNGIMVYMLNENGEFVKTKNIPTLYANIMSYNIDDERFEKKYPARFTWQEKINQFNNRGLSVGNELYPNLNMSK